MCDTQERLKKEKRGTRGENIGHPHKKDIKVGGRKKEVDFEEEEKSITYG